jgi:hypothetical protein
MPVLKLSYKKTLLAEDMATDLIALENASYDTTVSYTTTHEYSIHRGVYFHTNGQFV